MNASDSVFVEDGFPPDDLPWEEFEAVPSPVSLEDAIRLQATCVVDLRRDAAANAALVAERRKAWETENAQEIKAARDSALLLIEAEGHLRGLALEAWELSDKVNKDVGPGCKVNEETAFRYDSGVAFEWAKQHHLCLALDVKAFEAAVKSGLVPAAVATVDKRPTVKLASDLAGALGL